MSLRSRLFNGDPRLEACRLQDSAHIAPGAVGDHVGKIHQALLLLNDASIGSAELLAKSYGIVTARAVLDYKTKRHIINTSYQTRPDNVVGKMTITALDEEMAFAESRGGGRPQCVDQIGGTSGNAGEAVNLFLRPQALRPQAFATNAKRQLTGDALPPKALSIKWQRTSAVGASQNDNLFRLLVGRAGELVVQFGMLIVHNGDASSLTIPYPHVVQVDHTDALILRKAANKVMPAASKVLQVIVCPFPDGDPAFGFTSGGGIDPFQAQFPNYILINAKKSRDDRGTLLHEMIHAATNLPESSHDQLKQSVFSIETNRTVLRPEHAKALNDSFFAA